jgi:hypothetical protein
MFHRTYRHLCKSRHLGNSTIFTTYVVHLAPALFTELEHFQTLLDNLNILVWRSLGLFTLEDFLGLRASSFCFPLPFYTSHKTSTTPVRRTFNMTFSSLFLCTLLVATPFAAAHTKVYTAELEPFGDNSQVTGKAVVFTAHGGTLAYSGSAADLAQAGTDSACADVNGKYSKRRGR